MEAEITSLKDRLNRHLKSKRLTGDMAIVVDILDDLIKIIEKVNNAKNSN